jgi:rRNA maturation RNase YbeY
MPIRFFTEDVKFKLAHPVIDRRWINRAIKKEKVVLKEINYIFCSDKYLLSLNQDYLSHDTFTDIITFDYVEKKGELRGEIYISTERVKENAKAFNVDFDMELHRVMIHGVLHLIGYKDKSPAQKKQMRLKEDAYLSLR